MNPTFNFKIGALCLTLAALSVTGCDSNDGPLEMTMRVDLSGDGSGRIESSTTGIDLILDCRILEGEVSGTCEDTFFPPEGPGIIVVRGIPGTAMDFSWESGCTDINGANCTIQYTAGDGVVLSATTTIDVKTERIVMTPPSAAMTQSGAANAVVISAQAVDEDGNNVPGVLYTFAVDNPNIVSMSQSDAQSVTVEALADGQALITASVQGKTGTAAVDVKLTN